MLVRLGMDITKWVERKEQEGVIFLYNTITFLHFYHLSLSFLFWKRWWIKNIYKE